MHCWVWTRTFWFEMQELNPCYAFPKFWCCFQVFWEVSDWDQCINFIENIRSSCIHLHGFQLFFLLPKIKEIISFNFISNVNFVCLRADSDRLAIVAKGFLKVQNFLASCKFWVIACRVLNKGGSALPTLFNGPEMLSFAFKANLFNEIYF